MFNRKMPGSAWVRLMVTVLAALTVLSGCSTFSGPLTFDNHDQRTATVSLDVGRTAATALQFTEDNAHKYWFDGSLKTIIQGHANTYNFTGEKDFGDNLLVDATIPGKHMEIASISGKTFVNADNTGWHPSSQDPGNPLQGMTSLGRTIRFLQGEQLPDDTVVGQTCSVYRFSLPKTVDPLPFSKTIDQESTDNEEYIRTLTVWIGKKQPWVCRMQWDLEFQAPQLGAPKQTYMMQMYDFNTTRMNMVEFNAIRGQIGRQ